MSTAHIERPAGCTPVSEANFITEVQDLATFYSGRIPLGRTPCRGCSTRLTRTGTMQINPDLYAQNHADKAASQATVKLVVAWLVGFATACVILAVIGLWALGVA